MRLSFGHLFVALCLFGLGLLAATAPDRCEVCIGPFVRNEVYTRTDAWTGEPRKFCDDCRKLRERCAICGMPVKNNVTEVGDGRYLEHIGEINQIARLLSNNYTEGQIDLFVKVYHTYDLNPVLNWMKYGVDPYLKEADLDRVRFVDIPAPPAAAATEVIPVWSPPPPAPEQLTLTGLLGSGSRAVAMVNGGMISAGETTTVRVGTNRVALRCLSITTNQVTLELSETGERVVLEWRPKP